MVPFIEDKAGQTKPPTAVFFYEQTADALSEAIKTFERANFDSIQLVRHASEWGVPTFKKKIRQAVNLAAAAKLNNK